MSAAGLEDFMKTPNGIVADVKMLNFFRNIGLTAGIVIALLVLLSMVIQDFWCRYLCSYGASIFSRMKIRRDAEACIDCGKCARISPADLAVAELVQIRSAECRACMVCAAACPAENALLFALPGTKTWQERSGALAVPSGHRCHDCLSLLRSRAVCPNYEPLANEQSARNLHEPGAAHERGEPSGNLSKAPIRLDNCFPD